MAKQDGAREPLTTVEKKGLRVAIIILIATAIVIAGFFAMLPMLGHPARTDDLLALIAGFLMLQVTVMMTIVYTGAPKDPDTRQPLTYVLTAATTAATLLLPIIGDGRIDPKLNFAIILVLSAAAYWFSWRIWRASDELDRKIMMETNSANYWVLCTALVVYAVGERLGLLGGVTAWAALAFATLASIPVGIWVYLHRAGADMPNDG